MDSKRICEILQSKQIKDIYYKDQPVWIQELKGNNAQIGFLNSPECKVIHIDDLYEIN